MNTTMIMNTPEGAAPRRSFDKTNRSDELQSFIDVQSDEDSQADDPMSDPGWPDDFLPPDEPTAVPATAPEPEVFKHVRPLGINRDKNTRVYHVKASNLVVELTASRHTQSELLGLASLEAWSMSFPVLNGKGEALPNKFSLSQAADALHRACERVGAYSESALRGLGCWMDEGRFIVNAGSHLLVDGVPFSYDDIRSRNIYQPGTPLIPKGQAPATVAQAGKLLELCQSLPFRTTLDGELLAGWIALAPVCGILDWRPHGIITSASGKGKTWILNMVVGKALGDCKMGVKGCTTEPGVRQGMGRSNLPVVFDEAEAESQEGAGRIQKIFELMRVSSNGDGQKVIKGTAEGKAQDYSMQSMFLLAGVGLAAERKADRSRLTVFEFASQRSDEENRAQFGRLCDLARHSVDDPRFQAALLTRLLRMGPVMKHNAGVFSFAMAKRLGDRRLGDQLGALLAGWHALRSDDRVTEEEATLLVEARDWSPYTMDAEETDERQALQRLLDHTVRISPTTTKPVGEMIREMLTPSTSLQAEVYHTELAKIGIKVTSSHVAVANSHAALEPVYQNTTFLKRWSIPLSRLPGAFRKTGERIGGSQRNCVMIPRAVF